MGDGADLPGADHGACGLDGGRVAVVETDRALDPGLGHGGGDRAGVVGGEPDRLLDPDVLARPCHGDADLAVQKVRRGDAHGLDPGVGGDLLPVPDCGGEAIPPGGLLGPSGHFVGDGDQFGPYGQLREVVRQPDVRLGVHPSHPAESHDGDPERAHHDCPSLDRSINLPAHTGSPIHSMSTPLTTGLALWNGPEHETTDDPRCRRTGRSVEVAGLPGAARLRAGAPREAAGRPGRRRGARVPAQRRRAQPQRAAHPDRRGAPQRPAQPLVRGAARRPQLPAVRERSADTAGRRPASTGGSARTSPTPSPSCGSTA